MYYCLISGLSHSQQFAVLKQSRDSEEQSLLQHRRQTEELQALQKKVRWMTCCQSPALLIRLNGHHWQGMHLSGTTRLHTQLPFSPQENYVCCFLYSGLHCYHPVPPLR